MKAPLLVLLAASASASVGAKRSPPSPPPQAQIVVCNNGTKVEPSLHEIIQSLLPHDLPADQLATLQALYEGYFKGQRRGGNIISQRLMEFALSVVDRASRLTVPLRSFVSDGAFTVDMTTDWFYFRDVLLVQENFWAINALCAFIPPQLAAVRAVLCKCFVGEQLSPRDAVIASSRFSNFHAGNAHQWCVRNPCTDRSTRDGRCAVVVDPFRTSCILIPQSAVPAAIATSSSSSSSSDESSSSSGGSSDAGDVSGQPLAGITPFSVNLVKYNLTTPVMDKTAYGMERVFETLEHAARRPRNRTPSPAEEALSTGYTHVERVLNVVAALTPMYLFNLGVGCSFMLFSDELASSSFVQYLIAGCFGTVLAIIWLAASVYKMIENVTKSALPPFHPLLAPVSFLSTSYFFTGPMVRDRVGDVMLSFWRHGAFDLPWLGKAYFLSSIVVSLVLTYSLGLFSPKSSSFTALRLAISFVGFASLAHSTPSTEICAVILGLCLNREHIDYALWRVYMHAAASPPTEFYTGKRLSREEYETEGRKETEKALQQLQQYLAKNPEEMSKVCDYQANIQNGTSTLVDRFVRGHYSGLPRREVEEAPEGQGSVLWVAVTVAARAAAAAGVAFVVMFLASKRYA